MTSRPSPTPSSQRPTVPSSGADGSVAVVEADQPQARRAPDEVGEALVARVSQVVGSHGEHSAAVAAAVAHWSPMAQRIAGSFRRRTSEPEDLQQVALTALVQAVLRYRPEIGAFPSYAVPCISGEIRRWMRDSRGLAHVPRRVVELDLQVVRTEERLWHATGRQVSAAEVGAELGVTTDDVQQARAGRASRSVVTLDGPQWHGTVGREDAGLDRVEAQAALAPLLRRLDARSQQVMVMRFYGERTQTEIAASIGVSQVQVSRIIRRSLDRMRQMSRG